MRMPAQPAGPSTPRPDCCSRSVAVTWSHASVGAVANWSFSDVTAGHTLAASFMVGNHAPTLSVPDSVTAQEGAVLSFVASASDPDLPAPALTFSLVTPTPAGVTVGISTGQVQWTPSDNGSFTIRVRVSDGLAASASDVPVRVLNVAPTANITSPAAGALYAVGAPVSPTGGYADPGTGDTHTAQWVVDGQLVPALVTPSTHTVTGAWATAVPGVLLRAVRGHR